MTDPENENKKARQSKMLSIREVALIFQVHPSTIRRWCENGMIKAHRTGPRSARCFRREDVAVLYLDRAIRKYLK